ncbi:MAG: response regulator [Methylocystis sp.]|uniref:response regulator n=1 Tax=Methylocystis sp. TaxID=1911079 RepID=UPI003DA1F892
MKQKSDTPRPLRREKAFPAPNSQWSDVKEKRLARQTRVLVIDNEPGIHRVLRPALKACGYETIEATTGQDALELIATTAPDAIILDLDLPDVDGHAFLIQMRSFSDMPIIILSARKQEIEKITALESGADDYIEKPFTVGEFIARLRTALRHASGRQEFDTHRIEAVGLTVDLKKRCVSRNGAAINLTPKEYDLIAVFARNAGFLLTHREIFTAVWGTAHESDTRLLRVLVGQLRAKIEENPARPRIIQTEQGLGYRFAATAGR